MGYKIAKKTLSIESRGFYVGNQDIDLPVSVRETNLANPFYIEDYGLRGSTVLLTDKVMSGDEKALFWVKAVKEFQQHNRNAVLICDNPRSPFDHSRLILGLLEVPFDPVAWVSIVKRFGDQVKVRGRFLA